MKGFVMGSYYSVVQYVPNPLSGEAINFGVLAYEGDEVKAVFTADWDRLRRFGGQDIRSLREFARRIERASDANTGEDRLTEDEVRRMSSHFIHSIQLTAPAGSLLDVSALLEDCKCVYLPSPRASKPKPRTRHAAIKIAKDALADALRSKGGDDALDRMQASRDLDGPHGPYKFAAVLTNGRPRAAVDAFSLEIKLDDAFERNIRAAAYSYKDIRNYYPDISVGVLMLEPPLEDPIFDRTAKMFSDEGAKVLTEDNIYDWADEAADLVLSHH
jgi:Protein of unknown function (DUF3037)